MGKWSDLVYTPEEITEYEKITQEELELYRAKNADYAKGGAQGEHGNFERVSSILALYPGLTIGDPRVVALVYSLKQLDQVLLSLSRGYEGSIEGLDERLGDIHVYAKITRAINRSMKNGSGKPTSGIQS